MRVPGTKRTVRAPDGTRWRVGRRWTSSRRLDLRRRRWRGEDALDAGPRGDGGGGGGGAGADPGGVGDLLDADDLAVTLALLLVLGLVILLFFPLVEALVAVVFLVGGVAARVVLGHPWRVEARMLSGPRRRSARRATWQVVGFRRSGAVAEEVAARLAADGELPDPPRRIATPRGPRPTGGLTARPHRTIAGRRGRVPPPWTPTDTDSA